LKCCNLRDNYITAAARLQVRRAKVKTAHPAVAFCRRHMI
jgi:hypothetical protein